MNKHIDVLMFNPRGCGSRGFPFGIAILSAILRQNNFKVGLVDSNADQIDFVTSANKIIEINPKIVCFTGLWDNFSFIKKVSILVRNKLPETIQLAGGWWASPNPEFVLRETPIDYVVCGEADNIITNLCANLLHKTSPLDIPGICYLDYRGQFFRNCTQNVPINLNDIPLPDYGIFDMSFYIWEEMEKMFLNLANIERKLIRNRFGKKKVWKCCAIYSGRGCYGACNFCSAAGSVRHNYSHKYVVDHMEKMQKEFKVEIFNFQESLTFSSKNWVKDFCSEIIKRRLSIFYMPQVRADFDYDTELLNLIRRSGCYAINVGFESGNAKLLKSMNKNIALSKYYNLVDDFQKNRISVWGSFILNMPGETEESLGDTLTFVKNSRIHAASAGFASPYPQTRLFQYAKENGFIQNERDLLLRNPGRNKGRANFQAYIKEFNFNNISPFKLMQVKKSIDQISTVNQYRFRNKFIYYILSRKNPLRIIKAIINNIYSRLQDYKLKEL